MNRFTFLLILLFFPTLALFAAVEFVVISPSYNNERYCKQSLESLFSQTYPHWHLLYINDCSQDRTGLIAESTVLDHALSKKCTLIHNPKRLGAMANIYKMVHNAHPDKVIVHLDGDDRLEHPKVLELLAKVYEDPTVWVTYGDYRSHPFHIGSVCKPFPKEVIKKRAFRSFSWSSSHLKTYYARLFQKIRKKDLQHEHKFLSVASDVAFMLPILEMASKNHIRYIPEILYVYNAENPLNDDINKRAEVVAVESMIRSRKPYKVLKKIK